MTQDTNAAWKEDLLLGAVAEDPAVVTIWDAFKARFNKRGFPFDYILYTNYDRMVADLIDERIDVAWNTPLAWIRAQRMAEKVGKQLDAVAMRDIDRDLTSLIAVSADSNIKSVDDLKGKVFGVGSRDSVESLIMPCGVLQDAGLVPGDDFQLRYYSDILGLHGGDQAGEVRAAQALAAGEVDAAGLATGNYEQFVEDGTIPAGATRVLAHTPLYDHCNMTVSASAPRERIQRMRELFVEMDSTDPELREAMELQVVKKWQPARLTHYGTLRRAVEQFDAALA